MDQNSPRYWCVVPAAGVGARMQQQQPKSYLPLLDKTVIEYTLNHLLAVPEIEQIVVVLAQGDQIWSTLPISQHTKITTAIGGQERCHSVCNGLTQLLAQQAIQEDWVLVHDVARPCVSLQDIQSLIQQCENHAIGGLLACPMVETVKQTNTSQQVICTLDRSQLWRAQTPQLFRIGLLQRALQQSIHRAQWVTDESHAIELLGEQPLLVKGASDNIKITYPADLLLAESILRSRLNH